MSSVALRTGAVARRKPSGQLDLYDPDKGLKKIAVSESAVKHFLRGKQLNEALEAIEHQFKAMREFVWWWDGLPGRDGMPTRMVIERWRKAVKTRERP